MATGQADTQEHAQVEASTPKAGFAPMRFRAILAALLLCIPVTYVTTNTHVSGIFSLMTAPISALLLCIILNVVLRKVAPRAAFSQADLIVIFCVTAVAGSIAGEWTSFGMGATYSYPYHSKWSDGYKNGLSKHVPDLLAIKDFEQVKDVQGGGKDIGYVIGRLPTYFPIWSAWAGIICTLCFAMLCLNSLMRGAWCERERLTFPLIQLPVAMAENGGAGGMWKSRFMWIAFAVMFSIDMLNGINYLYPSVPAIPMKDLFYIDRAFKEPPLSNVGDFRISIYPFMAAIGLFIPSDLLISMVVFFLLRKATHVMLASQGIPQSTFSGTGLLPGPPYFDEQTWGGVIALFLGALWVSREYLGEVWRDIKTGVRSPDGGIKHRTAFAGLVLSFLFLVGVGLYGGLPLPYMLMYVALFLVFSVVLTRIRAQLGPPTHEFAFFGSNSIMHRFMGTKWISDAQAAYVAQVFLVMNRIYRNHPMPYQLEAMKMGGQERLNQKKLFLAILVATVVGFYLAHFFAMVKIYRTGEIYWTDALPYMENILRDRKGPDIIGIVMTIVGFAVVMVLDAIRFRFPGFPLHPAGYVLSMNYGVDYYWFGMLIALLVKNFVQKYYGLNGYDKLRQVAFGILLGEYAAETIWVAMALITNESTYTISFNDRSLGAQ
jgi:hypothetical protein